MPAETPSQEPNPPSPLLSMAPMLDVLHRLGHGLGVRKPVLVLTGASGMGKSALAREAARRFGDRANVVHLSAAHLDPKAIAGTVQSLFGGTVKPGTSPLAVNERLLETLANATARGRVAVLVVDDAHTLADDVLVELQRITAKAAQRQCPLELLLVGQPALAARLEEPALAAVNEQVALRLMLAPLNAHDTRRYLLLLPAAAEGGQAPQFSRKACRDIHAASRGLPRDIEAIAAEAARRAARANSSTISPEHVRAAAQALHSRPAAATSPKPAPLPAKSAPASHRAASQGAKSAATSSAPTSPARSAESRAVTPAAERPTQTAARATEPAAPKQPVEAKQEPAASEEEFTPSDDPRVKDWVSRFGGAGVRIGGIYMGPVGDEVEEEVPEEQPVKPAERVAARPASHKTRHDEPDPSLGSSADVHEVPQPSRGDARALVGAGVAASAPDEPVNWPPPRALPRKGPVLGQRRSSSLAWPALALLLAIALGAVMLAQRRGLGRPESDTSTAENLATADSSVAPAEPARTIKPRRTKAKATVAHTEVVDRPLRPARTAPPALSAPGTHYTVMVGSFLKADMVWAEREHLSRLTDYPVWVSRRSIDGVRTYRIILGAFESVEAAETAAQALLQRGLLRDAKVLPLPLAP